MQDKSLNTSPWAQPNEPKSTITITITRHAEFDIGVDVQFAYKNDIDPGERFYLNDLAAGARAMLLADPNSLVKTAAIYELGIDDAERAQEEEQAVEDIKNLISGMFRTVH